MAEEKPGKGKPADNGAGKPTSEKSSKEPGSQAASATKRAIASAQRGKQKVGRGARKVGRGVQKAGKYSGATSAGKAAGKGIAGTAKGIKRTATARPTKWVGRKVGRAGYRAGRGVLNKAAPAGSARAKALQKGQKYARNVWRSSLAVAKITKKTIKVGVKTTWKLISFGPAGWIALVLLLILLIVLWLVFYFNASAGSFSPVRPEEREPVAQYGLSADIPSQYFRLYTEAAAKYEVPWQVLAAWGDVATDHGRKSPYDCVYRIDPTSALGYSTILDKGLPDSSYLKKRMRKTSPTDGIPSQQGWMPEIATINNSGVIVVNDLCGPYGWLHQWCGLHTNTPSMAPDPPIADHNEGAWRRNPANDRDVVALSAGAGTHAGDAWFSYDPLDADSDLIVEKQTTSSGQEHTSCRDGSRAASVANQPSTSLSSGGFVPFSVPRYEDYNEGVIIENAGRSCGPMLLRPSQQHSCYDLQNPAYAIGVVAETISEIIGDIPHLALIDGRSTNRYIQAILNEHEEGIALGEAHVDYGFGEVLDAFYGVDSRLLRAWVESQVDVPYSGDGNHGDMLRSTSEFFASYWGLVLDAAVPLISRTDMGKMPDCSEAHNLPLRPGDPTNFTHRAYCYLALNGAPPYHDWRLSGLANEGIAVGDLAARLWARDLTRVSWVWNEWGNPRGNIPDGLTRDDVDDEENFFERSLDGVYKPWVDEEGMPERLPDINRCHSLFAENEISAITYGGISTTQTEILPFYSGTWIPFPGVTCEQLETEIDGGSFASEAEYAAYLIQKKGWGGLAGHVHETIMTCKAPSKLHADLNNSSFSDVQRSDGKWTRHGHVAIYFDTQDFTSANYAVIEAGDDRVPFCPLDMKLHDGNFVVAATVGKAIVSINVDDGNTGDQGGDTEVGGGAAESAETPSVATLPENEGCVPLTENLAVMDENERSVFLITLRENLAEHCVVNRENVVNWGWHVIDIDIETGTENLVIASNGPLSNLISDDPTGSATQNLETTSQTPENTQTPTGSTGATLMFESEVGADLDIGNPGTYPFSCSRKPGTTVGHFTCGTIVSFSDSGNSGYDFPLFKAENSDTLYPLSVDVGGEGLWVPTWKQTIPDGCGDPYSINEGTPVNNCETYVLPSWATLGDRCHLPGDGAGRSLIKKSMPAGHDFFPRSRTTDFGSDTLLASAVLVANSNLACWNIDENTPKAEPTRAIEVDSYENVLSFALTVPDETSSWVRNLKGESVRSRQIVAPGFVPLLPSIAYPAISDPSPHTWLGWTSDIPHSLSPLDNIPDGEDGGDLKLEYLAPVWSAGREIAYRARWISGGVQTEHGGSLELQFGDDLSLSTFVAQARNSQDDVEDCDGVVLASGAVCDSWKEMKAAAADDGVVLMGGGHRTAQRQYAARIKNKCNKGGEATVAEILSASASELGCKIPAAPVGTSLHQYGYAIDFSYWHDDPTQPNPVLELIHKSRPEFVWLQTHAWRWGWYNLPSEPWHWSTTGA